MTLAPGTRIRLTEKASKGMNSRPKRRFDWTLRRGVVKAIGVDSVYIIWDGTKSFDQFPLQAIEEDTCHS